MLHNHHYNHMLCCTFKVYASKLVKLEICQVQSLRGIVLKLFSNSLEGMVIFQKHRCCTFCMCVQQFLSWAFESVARLYASGFASAASFTV
jgi:hypothetical protein